MFQWTSSFVVTSDFCFAEQARMYEYQVQSFFVATLWENHGELWLWDERERVEHTLDPKWRDERDSCKYSLQGAMLITNDVFAFPIL
jgi:hypothetical protein